MNKFHEPVLLEEVLKSLKIKDKVHLKNKLFIDATLGLGGYTAEIIKKGGIVLGIDADSESLEIAREKLNQLAARACPGSENENIFFSETNHTSKYNLHLANGNFINIDGFARQHGFDQVYGIVFDLGISSFQIDSSLRGFSFKFPDAPLDMRMDKTISNVKANDLLNVLNVTQLSEVFNKVMSSGSSKRLTQKVVEKRKSGGFQTVGDFLQLVGENNSKKKGLHPATLPFLALRIAVNSELENLKIALNKSLSLLQKGGRIVVVSFHSAEDKLVKEYFRQMEIEARGKIITKKPVMPNDIETEKNPRSRSARMRVLEFI